MTGFFITGTDTEVGKTYITCALARHYRTLGETLAVRKPLASGCGNDLTQCIDAQALAQASGEDEWLVCPYRFSPAVSPARAMQENHEDISLEQLLEACYDQSQHKRLLVEGAGGWLSPLTPTLYNADLAIALNLPVILVVANRLGCINHTLLTLHHIQQVGLVCHKIILNDTQPNQSYHAYQELAQHLTRHVPHLQLIHQGYDTNTKVSYNDAFASISSEPYIYE
jgi:dethiobiotin synthetase